MSGSCINFCFDLQIVSFKTKTTIGSISSFRNVAVPGW